MKELEHAVLLRKQGHLKESNGILIELVKRFPDDPMVQYQCAWSFDVLEQEEKAVCHYEKAIKLGLTGEELRGAYLGLGSTYRTLGEYEKSRDVFLDALKSFPDDRAMTTFYAMTLYNLKEYSEAMKLLLINLADTSGDDNIRQYKSAIRFYSGDLDKTW